MKGVALGDICKVTAGQSAPQDPKVFGKIGKPFIRAGCLENLVNGGREQDCELIPDDNAARNRMRLFPKDTILFAKSGMSAKIGRVHRLQVPSYVVSHLAAVIPGPKVDSSYLQRWFEKNPPSRLIPNEAYPSIRTSEISKLIIDLPSLAEQKRISAILDKADTIRRKRRQAIKLADDFFHSTFLDMFGDPVTNPKGWPIKAFRDIAEKFSDGPFGSNLKSSHYVDDGIRVIRLQNIGTGRFIDDDRAFISEDHFQSLSKHKCMPGDVLIGTLGDPNLRACLLPSFIDKALNKADCIQFRPKINQATSEFVSSLINQPGLLCLASHLLHGQTRTRISMGTLRELMIPVPPLSLQKKFTKIYTQANKLMLRHNQMSSKEENLFNSLTQRAFRGEL
jgi:type I restriction enzyme S subunit